MNDEDGLRIEVMAPGNRKVSQNVVLGQLSSELVGESIKMPIPGL